MLFGDHHIASICQCVECVLRSAVIKIVVSLFRNFIFIPVLMSFFLCFVIFFVFILSVHIVFEYME